MSNSISNMSNLFESFRKFLDEETKGLKRSDIYSVEALLVIRASANRTKNDILSDLRAIEGITVVRVVDQRDVATLEYSQIKIKIDTTPLHGESLPTILLKIKKEANKIIGVTRFEYASRPSAIN